MNTWLAGLRDTWGMAKKVVSQARITTSQGTGNSRAGMTLPPAKRHFSGKLRVLLAFTDSPFSSFKKMLFVTATSTRESGMLKARFSAEAILGQIVLSQLRLGKTGDRIQTQDNQGGRNS